MQTGNQVAAAMMATAVFNQYNRPAGTDPEAEMRRIYRRFLGFVRKLEQPPADLDRMMAMVDQTDE